MKGGGDSRCGTTSSSNLMVVKSALVFYILLQMTASSQNVPIHGVPLPIAKEGQLQGHFASGGAPRPSENFNSNTKFLVNQNTGQQQQHPTTFGVSLPAVTNHNNNLGFTTSSGGVSLRPGNMKSSAGGLKAINNPSQDAGVSKLVNHPVVLKTIQKETRADKAVKVDSVINAHKQIVSGQMTYLDLKVAKTKCPVGTRLLHHCEIDRTEDPFICEVAVWERPWLNSTKVIQEETKCAEAESTNDFMNWNKGRSGLRDMTNEISLHAIPNYLDQKQIGLEAFDYINRGSESKFKGQMVDYRINDIKHDPRLNLTSMEVKVEYGFTLCLKFPNVRVLDRVCPSDTQRANYVCSVKVISDPNLTTNLKVQPSNDDEIDCVKKQQVSEDLVIPVSGMCLGCPETISLNDPNLMAIADFAVIEFDRSNNDDELHKMVKLHKAQRQVVNGIKYFLTIELVDTHCKKPLSPININRTLCEIDEPGDTDICEIVILEHIWKSKEFIAARCQDSFSGDSLIIPRPGGANGFQVGSQLGPGPHSGVSGNHPATTFAISSLSSDMQESVAFLLTEINRREVDDHDDGIYKILNILKASTVNEPIGPVDIIVLELGETVCRGRNIAGDCPLKINEEHEICTGKVHRDSSQNQGTFRRLVLLKCDEDKYEHFYLSVNPTTSPFVKSNRPFFTGKPATLGLPGGPSQQPTDSSATIEIANFVVDQFNLQNDDDELYKLGRIISSYSQLSGTPKHTIEIELLETYCKKYQALTDISLCPVDRGEDPEICQAEVSLHFTEANKSTKKLLRMYCDEREDYYVKKFTKKRKFQPRGGQLGSENVNDDKIQHFGKLVADEFDLRSDEDHIFVLFKVLEAKSQIPSLSHYIRVELAETICPKYKQRIDKTRCVVDIGEDHKICEANIEERPWIGDHLVSRMSCTERDDSIEDDESREVVYRQVHPSAHARPKFVQSRYRIRQHSQESDESNEKYYHIGGVLHRQSRDEDSDEFTPGHFHQRNLRRSQRRYSYEDDDDDSDQLRRGSRDREDDSRSNEHSSFNRFRFRRSGGPGVSTSVAVDDKIIELAEFSLAQMDGLSEDPNLRRVDQVISATQQVVSGMSYQFKIKAVFTTCAKQKDPLTKEQLSECSLDSSKPSHICDVTLWVKPWLNFKKVTDSMCRPETL